MGFKRKWYGVTAVFLAALLTAGCSSSQESSVASDTVLGGWEPIPASTDTVSDDSVEEATEAETVAEASTEALTEEEEEDSGEIPAGTYLSELTGEPISQSIQNQRPIAMMIDNDERALPHYGITQCDVVYELMNSTENNRITRFMAVMKDWGSIVQLGGIRSTRPTNIMLAPEWNAVLCHDGGPYYNDSYFAQSWAPPHFSGYFSRVDNGKATEFTEYCLSGEMAGRFSSAGVSTSYTAYPGNHFKFADYGSTVDLSAYSGSFAANTISLPFWHTSSTLRYNSSTGTYDYYEYGSTATDGVTGRIMTFKNVIIQDVSFTQLDANGYMVYNCVGSGSGYYMTNGYTIPITWSKGSESAVTRFYDASGSEITVNAGKTYIAMVPSDTWSSFTIQ